MTLLGFSYGGDGNHVSVKDPVFVALNNYPELKQVKISDCDRLRDKDLMALARTCSNVKAIEFTQCYVLNRAALKVFKAVRPGWSEDAATYRSFEYRQRQRENAYDKYDEDDYDFEGDDDSDDSDDDHDDHDDDHDDEPARDR